MSAMLLEKNSEKSSTKNIKHINMRYYIIKDQVEPGEVITDHFTTTEMSENHLMKPLHGALFRKFRTEIMNIPDDMDMGDTGMDGSGIKKGVMWKLHNKTDPGCPQECVGDDENVGGRNGADYGSNGHVFRVRTYT